MPDMSDQGRVLGRNRAAAVTGRKRAGLPEMSNRRRPPNALKHGAFSRDELLPWEDAGEYQRLRQGLIEEHQPQGTLEEDCIDTIASLLWQKRRVRAKRNLDIAAELDRVENRVTWKDPPPLFETKLEGAMHALSTREPGRPSQPRDDGPREDYSQLFGFSASLYGLANRRLVQLSVSMLPAEFNAHLNEKVPSDKFEDTMDWVVALKKEVDGALLPMVRSRAPQANVYYERAAAFLTSERIIQDLDVEDRLDGAIDRALKRLYQLQMARELRNSREPKLIEPRPPKQLRKPADPVCESEE